MFPLIEKDYSNWNTLGSAVFLKEKAVITPQVGDRRGLIHTTKPNMTPNHWMAIVDFKMGNRDNQHVVGEGMGIYYLKDIDPDNPNLLNNFYGYTNDYRGFGVLINSKNSYPEKNTKKKVVQIFGFANDGKNMAAKSRPDKQCFKEVFGDKLHFSKLKIEYEEPVIRVSVFEHDSAQFVHCFSMDMPELNYQGIFAISASSGTDPNNPIYTTVNSFKVYDPKLVQMNH